MLIELGSAVEELLQQEGAVLMVRHLPIPADVRESLEEDEETAEMLARNDYLEATIHVPGKLLVKTWCFGIEGALECLGDEALRYNTRSLKGVPRPAAQG